MENRLLNQFNQSISTQWPSQEIVTSYDTLNHKELFELAYHTCNSVNMRNIFIKLSQDENKGGSKAILYSNTKKFVNIESFDDNLKIIKYFPEDNKDDKLVNEIKASLETRKLIYSAKEKDQKTQILKTILVERKLDECANLVMLKEINRKIYFAIGDARESAAVVPIFMDAEGASLVQLALNKWMTMTQNLEQENTFPDSHVAGLLKNLMQIKKWLLNLISVHLEK
ncbi:MAG: hypothetical protein ACFFAO_01015 [Candidatus Hermodarchaeota archaeon]